MQSSSHKSSHFTWEYKKKAYIELKTKQVSKFDYVYRRYIFFVFYFPSYFVIFFKFFLWRKSIFLCIARVQLLDWTLYSRSFFQSEKPRLCVYGTPHFFFFNFISQYKCVFTVNFGQTKLKLHREFRNCIYAHRHKYYLGCASLQLNLHLASPFAPCNCPTLTGCLSIICSSW